jgi:hypothetical protein
VTADVSHVLMSPYTSVAVAELANQAVTAVLKLDGVMSVVAAAKSVDGDEGIPMTRVRRECHAK